MICQVKGAAARRRPRRQARAMLGRRLPCRFPGDGPKPRAITSGASMCLEWAVRPIGRTRRENRNLIMATGTALPGGAAAAGRANFGPVAVMPAIRAVASARAELSHFPGRHEARCQSASRTGKKRQTFTVANSRQGVVVVKPRAGRRAGPQNSHQSKWTCKISKISKINTKMFRKTKEEEKKNLVSILI